MDILFKQGTIKPKPYPSINSKGERGFVIPFGATYGEYPYGGARGLLTAGWEHYAVFVSSLTDQEVDAAIATLPDGDYFADRQDALRERVRNLRREGRPLTADFIDALARNDATAEAAFKSAYTSMDTRYPFKDAISLVVTVSGGVFYIDGVQQDSLSFDDGQTYLFDQSDASNVGHPLKIYDDANKTNEITGYSVATVGTPGTAGAYTRFVCRDTGTFSYQCENHSAMGGDITVSGTTFAVTVAAGTFSIDGVQQDSLSLETSRVYIFDQSDASNAGHLLKIYDSASKTNEVIAYVNVVGTPGSAGAYTEYVPHFDGDFSYQCENHVGMGGDITVLFY